MVKWLVLVVGFLSLLIFLVLFASYKQQQILNFPNIEGSSFTEVLQKLRPGERITPEELNQQKKNSFNFSDPSDSEKYNTTVIKRGSFLTYSNGGQVITIEDDFSSTNDSISIAVNNIDSILCWPDTVNNPDGTQTFLRESYIPFVPQAPIAWSSQTVKPRERVLPTLDNSDYLFFRLSSPYVRNSTNYALEVAVLGC